MRRDDYQPREGLEVRESARFVELGECRACVEVEDEAEEIGNPLQYSHLENSMDRAACQAAVHGVAKSWTQLSNSLTCHAGGFGFGLCPESNKAV